MEDRTSCLRSRGWLAAGMLAVSVVMLVLASVSAGKPKATKDKAQTGGATTQPDKSAQTQPADKTVKSLRVASMGHSIVGPAMRPFRTIALAGGYDKHRQFLQLASGASGSPLAHWKKTGRRQKMKPALATGTWDVLTMGVYHGSTAKDFSRWIDLGLKHNEKMVFFIQDSWPLLPDPALGRKLKFFELAQKTINDRVGAIVGALNKKYPDKVHVLPVGDGMVELVRRVLKRELPGVTRIYVPKSARRRAAGLYRDAVHPTKLVAQLEGYIYWLIRIERT